MQTATVVDVRRNRVKAVAILRTQLNREDRIIKALGAESRIPKVHEEPHFRYYKYLAEHLRLPIIAHVPKPMNTAEEDDFRCTVLRLLDPAKHASDGFDGICCTSQKGAYEITLPLIDVYLPEDSFGFQLIDDYWFWFWNWR